MFFFGKIRKWEIAVCVESKKREKTKQTAAYFKLCEIVTKGSLGVAQNCKLPEAALKKLIKEKNSIWPFDATLS